MQVMHDVVLEGRYFPNPYTFKRIIRPITIISQNEVGVKIRRFGKPLPFPKTVATDSDERGPVAGGDLEQAVDHRVESLDRQAVRKCHGQQGMASAGIERVDTSGH